MRRVPPERFHVFVSYTTREDEVRVAKPMVDHFVNTALRPVIEATLGEPFVFYDGYHLRNLRGVRYPDFVLRRALKFAIEESEVLLAFVSPEYPRSEWCVFECTTMADKSPRPWFDVCRSPPIEELRDKRRRELRPTWWDCVEAWWRTRSSSHRGAAPPSRDTIVPIMWKGDLAAPRALPMIDARRVFDWTSCSRAFGAEEKVDRWLIRHGSVSPAWKREAAELRSECANAMAETAAAVARILQARRDAYRSAERIPGALR